MNRYLGGSLGRVAITGEGDPFAYADAVAKALGTTRDAKLKDVFKTT
jgi:hypothetical protein